MKSKPKQKIAFIQKWGTYENETLVIVGATKDEILAFLKKIKVKADIIEKFKTTGPDEEGLKEAGLVWSPRNTGVTLLYFPDWKNDWEHWDTLVHETSHLIFRILGQLKGMENETEAQAYQQEFLFKQIRRKLWMLTAKQPKVKRYFKKLLEDRDNVTM